MESTLSRAIDIDMYYVMFQLERYLDDGSFSDLEKQVLKLYYAERKTYFEIEGLLSLEKNSVVTIYRACMEKLRKKASMAGNEYLLLKTVQQENTLLKRKLADLQELLEKGKAQKLELDKNILVKQFYELDRDFDLRTNNALKQAGINTFGDVILYSEADLLKIKNMGTKSVNWLKVYLEKLNLSLSKH